MDASALKETPETSEPTETVTEKTEQTSEDNKKAVSGWKLSLKTKANKFRVPDKKRKINLNKNICLISSPNPMFDHL